MLRIHQIANAEAAKKYYTTSDYFLETPGVWIGQGAAKLGLSGRAEQADFNALCDNLDPQSGDQLTAKHIENRRTGWDFNFNATKSVSIARELTGDDGIEAAHREAVDFAMKNVEADMRTRVRMGGKNEDRVTGNMVAMHVIHRTTRPNQDDHLPDMSLHSHVVVFNATYDPVEEKWKAAEIGGIKKDANWYEALYQNRLASNLRDLGYGIRRKGRAFEIAGISDTMIDKYSRRRDTVEQAMRDIEAKYGTKMGQEAKSKLGATTRLYKVDIKESELTRYWLSRLTHKEEQEIESLIGQKSYEKTAEEAVTYAIGHAYERQSVVGQRWLYGLALRHGIGSVTPESVQAEAKRQGLLVKAGEATTRGVLAEERKIIAFARDGRGTVRPMGTRPGSQVEAGATLESGGNDSQPIRESAESARHAEGAGHVTNDRATSTEQQAITANPQSTGLSPMFPKSASGTSLSAEQAEIARHVWKSSDRVIMIRGGAGTGKTRTMKTIIDGIDLPAVVLAPSAEASRKVLRDEGFAEAETVARFLIDDKFQQKAKGGVIWVDEAGLLGIRQVAQIFDLAKELGARVVLQGDKKQHASVERGATLRVLEDFAGLPVAELKDIRRQHGKYKDAVKSLAKGQMVAGFDKLDALGWVKQTPQVDHNKPLIDDYLAGLNAGKEMLVVAPTHVEGDQIVGEIRERLKSRGIISKDGREVETLVPLHWTDAEKGDVVRYEGTEVMQFHRNSGTFRAGDRLPVVNWKDGDSYKSPSHFSVYSQSKIELAAGDTIRLTANGKTLDDKHKLNNGATYQVKGFTKDGDIELTNKWVIAKDFGHLTHGYVTTSHASQGKTVDRVLIAMGNESLGAINAQQFYVSVSRGRESAKIYSDMSAKSLREAVQRLDVRKSATELMGDVKPPTPDRRRKFMERVRDVYEELRDRAIDAMRNLGKEREKEQYRGGR